MRSHEKRVLIARVECQRPDAHAWQMSLPRVNSRPGGATVRRPINAAAKLSILIVLIGIAGKNLATVARIDQDAREVAEGEITAAPRPMVTAIVRQVERLLGSHVDERRALLILHDNIDRRCRR